MAYFSSSIRLAGSSVLFTAGHRLREQVTSQKRLAAMTISKNTAIIRKFCTSNVMLPYRGDTHHSSSDSPKLGGTKN